MCRTAVLLALVLASLSGCGAPTGPSVPTIQHFQALWAAHHFTKYTYDSETTGFFNNLSGQTFRIVVLGDTVRSAQLIATGDTVPLAATKFTTIDGLFAAAIAARNASRVEGSDRDEHAAAIEGGVQ